MRSLCLCVQGSAMAAAFSYLEGFLLLDVGRYVSGQVSAGLIYSTLS